MRYLLPSKNKFYLLLGSLAIIASLNWTCPELTVGQETEVVAEIAATEVVAEELSISLNGALGGLVGITAGCDCFSTWWSMVIGACAGALVVAGVRLLDHLRIEAEELAGLDVSEHGMTAYPSELPGMMGMPSGYSAPRPAIQPSAPQPTVMAEANAN